MCQMPTGTGKTHVLAAVVSEYAKGKFVWVVAHRKELIEQIQRTWEKFYQGKKNAPDVRVMSIQWLSRNWDAVKDEHPAMIVIDEAHHALAETYQELFRRYPDAKKLGMTATPYRMSGKGFTDLFDVLLQSKSVMEFIMMKRLSLFDYFTIPQNSKIRKQIATMTKRGVDGDYQTKEMEMSLNTPRNIEYLYNSLKRYAKGRRGIVYAINISHAKAIADFYTEKGLKCCAIDCKTPAKERNAMVEAFRNGEIDVMVNVDIFSEGFDCPEVEFIQLARPTLSLAVYLQQVGRGLRKAKGKRRCIILDNVGLSHTFGTPLRQWQWRKTFEGKAGNLRIDEGDLKELRKHFGYPGKLADEPMEKIISHTDLNTSVKYQEVLEYISGSQHVGIRINGKTVAKKKVQSLIQYSDDIAAVRLNDGSVSLIFPTGKEIKFPPGVKGFKLLENSILQIVMANGPSIYRDLLTSEEFEVKPQIYKIGQIEFTGDGRMTWPRFHDFIKFQCHRVNQDCWKGFYFQAIGVCSAEQNVFVPNIKRDPLYRNNWAEIVLLPGDRRRYYFVGELQDSSILITTSYGEYIHINANLKKDTIYKGSNYIETRTKVEKWLAAHGGKFHPKPDYRLW